MLDTIKRIVKSKASTAEGQFSEKSYMYEWMNTHANFDTLILIVNNI